MARIYPFRALRYDTDKVRMEDVVTQPYDKITPLMQQAYYDRSPFNLIRVILGKREPDDTDAFAPHAANSAPHNVYTRAAETLQAWRDEEILRPEAEPALYGYSQTYVVPGTEETRERRGFIGLGHLYDYAEKVVYRHEQTFPKHKSDRLALFKATRAYCEQIYMLYSDPAFTAEQLIFQSKDGEFEKPADLAITDEYGVVHRVWRLTDPQLLNLLVTAMDNKKLLIADGHHRYETSVAYMKERAAELGIQPESSSGRRSSSDNDEDESSSNLADEPHALLPKPRFPEAAMMMTFVNMEAPGITILPTHRVVFGLDGFSAEQFLAAAEPWFSVSRLSEPDVKALSDVHGVAFLAVTRDGSFLLSAKADAVSAELKRLHPEITARQAELDVVQLHRILLEQTLGLSHESIARAENIRYLRESDEAIRQVRDGEAEIAFLIKPVTLEQLRDISLSGDVMPQKSTDFYPKLLSGLAIYALD